MDADYWQQRWKRGEISFHESEVNPALIAYLERLSLAKGARIFLPLCGKTRDIAWLLTQGYQVVGVELSALAINELFEELEMVPAIFSAGTVTRYSAQNLDLWGGDLFDLSSSLLEAVDAIYDRAALVALPEAMRNRYAAHLQALTNSAPQLLITYEYDQYLYEGPPFSVTENELQRHYADTYCLDLLDHTQIAGGLKGMVEAANAIWLLHRRER